MKKLIVLFLLHFACPVQASNASHQVIQAQNQDDCKKLFYYIHHKPQVQDRFFWTDITTSDRTSAVKSRLSMKDKEPFFEHKSYEVYAFIHKDTMPLLNKHQLRTYLTAEVDKKIIEENKNIDENQKDSLLYAVQTRQLLYDAAFFLTAGDQKK
jgi:hypothetical protein